MTTSAQRRVAVLGLVAVLVLAACGASDTPTSVATGSQSRTADTKARPASETLATTPVTATAQAPVTTTTAPPTTTTTAPRPATTTTTPRASATTATTASPPAPTTTTTTAPPTTAAAVVSGNLPASTQSEMLSLVNAKRASGTTCGGKAFAPVPALSLNGDLTRAADAHASDMATNNYFSHDSLTGLDPAARILATGYQILYWAENIAAGQPTASSVITTWFDSAGHCENFMSGDVTQIGFGEAENAASTYGKYWVADLGRPA